MNEEDTVWTAIRNMEDLERDISSQDKSFKDVCSVIELLKAKRIKISIGENIELQNKIESEMGYVLGMEKMMNDFKERKHIDLMQKIGWKRVIDVELWRWLLLLTNDLSRDTLTLLVPKDRINTLYKALKEHRTEMTQLLQSMMQQILKDSLLRSEDVFMGQRESTSTMIEYNSLESLKEQLFLFGTKKYNRARVEFKCNFNAPDIQLETNPELQVGLFMTRSLKEVSNLSKIIKRLLEIEYKFNNPIALKKTEKTVLKPVQEFTLNYEWRDLVPNGYKKFLQDLDLIEEVINFASRQEMNKHGIILVNELKEIMDNSIEPDTFYLHNRNTRG